MNRIKPIAYCLAGLIVSVIFYMLSTFTILPIIQIMMAVSEPEDLVPFAFQVVGTVCLFAGSILSGWLLMSEEHESSFFQKVLIAPGLYAAVYMLLQARGTIPYFVQIAIVTSIIWVVSSIAGVFLGSRLKSKRHANV